MQNDQLSFYNKDLETKILQDVFEQDFAVRGFIHTLAQSSLLQHNYKPKAIFTFIGQNNSGKKHLLETFVQYDPLIKKLKVFYMEQYNTIGSFDHEQQSYLFQKELITFIHHHQNSIIMFKDIQKADLQVQLKLFTILTQCDAWQLDLSQIIVVFDTTILSEIINRKDFSKVLQNAPLQAHTFLAEKLSQEFLSINEQKEPLFHENLLSLINEETILPFQTLHLKTLIKIASRTLHETSQKYTKKTNISIEYDNYEYIVWVFLLSLIPYLNPRFIKQKIPKLLLDKLGEILEDKKDVKSVVFKVSKQVENYLQEIILHQDDFIIDINTQHLHCDIQWNIKEKNHKNIVCSVFDIVFAKDQLTSHQVTYLHNSDISFEDIAGHKKVKEQLQEIIKLFKDPKNLHDFGLSLPKGLILHGPKGMGKKLLTKAFAKEIGYPYIVINGSDLFNIEKINSLYQVAYSHAPVIMIFEDIDTEGIFDGIISTMSLEPILTHLDQLVQNIDAPVFTCITTNNSQNIPNSLVEAQRINLTIEVPKLDMEARRFFIQELLKKPHHKDIDIERIVRYISGMSGNELKRLSQEVFLFAARKGEKLLTQEIIIEQINIIKYGTKLENKQIRDIEISMKKTAYHEAGHAVISYILLPKVKIEQVTISPRSETLGFVSYTNEEYIDAVSKQDIFNDICVLLAGRVAKMEKFGEDGMETGAMSDLEAATNQAYGAIALFGMDEVLGYINTSSLDFGSNKQLFANKIEERILVWLQKAKEKTEQEVKKNWNIIDAVAQELIIKEVIDYDRLKEIIKKHQ